MSRFDEGKADLVSVLEDSLRHTRNAQYHLTRRIERIRAEIARLNGEIYGLESEIRVLDKTAAKTENAIFILLAESKEKSRNISQDFGEKHLNQKSQ